MKEIKAYIRRDRVNETVEALQRGGAPGITIVEVHPVGYGYEPNYFESGHTEIVDSYSYLAVVKLEVVCNDADLERLTSIIEKCSRTGEAGDGILFVTDVIGAIRIRDGSRGGGVLN